MNELISKELGKKGPGQFVIPGLLKLKVVRKPATKAKQGGQSVHEGADDHQAKPGQQTWSRPSR